MTAGKGNEKETRKKNLTSGSFKNGTIKQIKLHYNVIFNSLAYSNTVSDHNHPVQIESN